MTRRVRPPRTLTGICRGERGGAAIETVLLGGVLVAMLLVVVLASRLTDTRLRAEDAARHAARAATLAPTPAQARADAHTTAHADLATTRCVPLVVTTALGRFAPGAPIQVRVSCPVALADLALLGVPGTVPVSASATSVLDRWRTTPPPGPGR